MLLFLLLLVTAHAASCGCGGLSRDCAGAPVAVERAPPPHAQHDNVPVAFAAHTVAIAAPATFVMGNRAGKYPADGEEPPRLVTVAHAYAMDATEVTVAQFREFVARTGYTTDAERYGWSFVFEGFVAHLPDDQVAQSSPWWVRTEGANWSRPFGARNTTTSREDEPVVHVSWNDAWAFCAWRNGSRLPTEAEWEYAARGGLEHKDYPWGDAFLPAPHDFRANTWTGQFPSHNTGADGYVGVAPVGSYPPNGYGLFDVSGNVWEWVADLMKGPDHTHALLEPDREPPKQRLSDWRVERGGSYMCHRSYCFRYRVTSRTGSAADSSSGNLGFRCAK